MNKETIKNDFWKSSRISSSYNGQWFTEIPALFKIDWKETSSKSKELVTVQLPEGSFIATPNDNKKEAMLRFMDWLLKS